VGGVELRVGSEWLEEWGEVGSWARFWFTNYWRNLVMSWIMSSWSIPMFEHWINAVTFSLEIHDVVRDCEDSSTRIVTAANIDERLWPFQGSSSGQIWNPFANSTITWSGNGVNEEDFEISSMMIRYTQSLGKKSSHPWLPLTFPILIQLCY
jgi:hypothetical protein